MQGNILNRIINFFYSKKILFAITLLVLLGIFSLGISKIVINESIFSALPKGNSFAKFSKLLDQGELTNQVIFTLDVENTELDELNEITSILSDSLTKYSTNYLKDIVITRPNLESKIFDHFYNSFPATEDRLQNADRRCG